MIVAITAGILVGIVSGLAKSLVFAIVSAYLFLLASNRWIEYRRVKRCLSIPIPSDEYDRTICLRIFYDEWAHPAPWLKVTNYIAAITAVSGVVAISMLDIALGNLWTRSIWGLADGMATLILFSWIKRRRAVLREVKALKAVRNALWSDLT